MDPRMKEGRAELRRLHEAAGPEAWSAGQAGTANIVTFDGEDIRPVGRIDRAWNRELAVAARNALPDLLDALDERDALLQHVASALARLPSGGREELLTARMMCVALLADLREAGFAPEDVR